VVRDDGGLHIFLFPGDDDRLTVPLLLGPIKHVDISGVADDDRQQRPAILLQPAGQLLFEDRKLVVAHAIDLERHGRALQAGVQAQAVEQTHRDELALRIARRVAGMLQVMAVHRPDRPARQLREGAQPVAGLEQAREDLVGPRRHLGDHDGAARGVEGIEPGGPGQRFAAVLTGLQEVAARIAVPEDALHAAAQKLFVRELRGVPPAAAVVVQDPQGRLDERLGHRHAGEGGFHVTRLLIQPGRGEHHRANKPPRQCRPAPPTQPRFPGIESLYSIGKTRQRALAAPVRGGWRGPRKNIRGLHPDRRAPRPAVFAERPTSQRTPSSATPAPPTAYITRQLASEPGHRWEIQTGSCLDV